MAARSSTALGSNRSRADERGGSGPQLEKPLAALLKIADGRDDEVDNAVSAMTSLLEPILIIFLAVVVGSIVIALFLPILALINPDTVPNPNSAHT